MTRRPKPRRVGLLPAREIRESPLDDAAAAGYFRCSVSAISSIRLGKNQPDAGGPIRTERPRKVVQEVARTVKLPRELADRIDRARGPVPFQRWMREAAEHLMRGTIARPTPPIDPPTTRGDR